MSGGSLDYVYARVEDAAREIRRRATCVEHRSFAELLDRVALALHDVEWVWSGDYGDGDELSAIKDCISPALVLETATNDALNALDNLHLALKAIGR